MITITITIDQQDDGRVEAKVHAPQVIAKPCELSLAKRMVNAFDKCVREEVADRDGRIEVWEKNRAGEMESGEVAE